MAVGDVYELNIEYGVHQRPMVCNTWWETVDASTDQDREAQDLVDAVETATLVQFLANLLSTACKFDQVKAYLRVPTGGGEAQKAPGFKNYNIDGVRSGEALPDSLPMIIEWEQTTVSAKANGRCFLSGVSEDDQDGNNLSAAFMSGPVATFIANWPTDPAGITGPDGGSFRQVLMSKLQALLPYDSAIYGSSIDVTSVVVGSLIKNQKRRQSRWEAQGRA